MISGPTVHSAQLPNRDVRGGASALVVLPLALTALVYYPITANYFYADDFFNLFQIANDHVARFLLTPNGGHALVTRNAIFYLFAKTFGVQPVYYFWSALLTHLVNVALLFGVIRLFTRSAPLAAFGATLWGVSPFHEGALGSYSVYGEVVVATVLLIILYQAARAAADQRPPDRGTLWLWYGLALAGATSFGVGISLAMVLPFVVALLLPTWRVGARFSIPLVSLLVVTPVLYEVLIRLYDLLAGQTFSSTQLVRNLVVAHPGSVLWAFVQLLAYGITGLVSGFLFGPWLPPTLWDVVLAAFMIATVLAFRAGSPEVRRQLGACALLVLSSYGIVAAGRGMALYRVPVDSFIALTRYHHVALIPLTIILCLSLSQLGTMRPISARARALLLSGWLALTLAAYVVAGPKIEHWIKSRLETEKTVASIRASIDATPPGEAVYIRNRPFPPAPPVIVPYVQFPGWAAVYVIFYPGETVDGRPVYFIEADAPTREAAKRGRRTRDLLVPPP